MTWPQIRSVEAFQGCWVALDQCRYEDRGGHPTEGTVVDFDADLAALCDRMREADSLARMDRNDEAIAILKDLAAERPERTDAITRLGDI